MQFSYTAYLSTGWNMNPYYLRKIENVKRKFSLGTWKMYFRCFLTGDWFGFVKQPTQECHLFSFSADCLYSQEQKEGKSLRCCKLILLIEVKVYMMFLQSALFACFNQFWADVVPNNCKYQESTVMSSYIKKNRYPN